MKIVNATELAKLPEGVIYSEYEPYILSELMVKGETLNEGNSTEGSHWFDAVLNNMKEMVEMEKDLKLGDSSPLEIIYSRAVHDPEEVFAVWELEDLKELKGIVSNAIIIMELME
jgi:hypothetical protein